MDYIEGSLIMGVKVQTDSVNQENLIQLNNDLYFI